MISSNTRLKKSVQAIIFFLLIRSLPASAQVSPNQGFFTTSDQVKLRYQEAGQGQAILLIPGWLMPSDIWEAQFADLSKDYHVIALDPRSQGRSDMTLKGNDPLRRSQDIRELLDHLQIKNVVLVGWALGAFDGLAYLRQFGADNLKGLVLVDSPLGAPSTPVTQRGKFLKLFQSDRENANQNYVWGLFKKHPSSGFIKKLTQSAALIPTDIALATLDNTQPGDNWQPTLKAMSKVPLLYAITPKYAAQAAWLQQVVPTAKVEQFETSGHALFGDEPEHFNNMLKDFIRQASLYPAGSAPGGPHTGEASSGPAPVKSPLPISLPAVTSTPLPALAFTFIPSSTPSLTPVPTLTPTLTMTLPVVPPATPVVSETPGQSPAAQVSPVETTVKTSAVGENTVKTTSTPSASLFTRLSKSLSSLWKEQATPGAQATPIFTPSLHPKTSETSFLSASPIQDGYFTTSDHIKLHYLEAGTGLTILFIPGWLLPADIWTPQFQGLSKDFHIVALDPRSQGLSDITPVGDEPLRQAKDIQELMDHLHLSSVVLVGWSHGGFQVLAYMGEFGTDRLYATVLVDSALGAASASPTSSAPRARFLEQFQKDRPAATRSFVWGLFKKHDSPDFYRRLTDSALRTPTDIAMALMNNAFPGESYQPSLVTMRQIPLLYAVTPKYTFQAQYLKAVAPLASVEIFQGTGHALFVDDADHFNSTLRDFLRRSSLYPPGWAHPTPKFDPAATPNYR